MRRSDDPPRIASKRCPAQFQGSYWVSADGTDATVATLRDLMMHEAKASLAAWHVDQQERQKLERKQQNCKRISNATISLINKSLRKHSRHTLSARNKERIGSMQRECNAAIQARNNKLNKLAETKLAEHKRPYCRPRSKHNTIESTADT